MADRSRILPTEEEIPDLVPAPGSVTWQRAGDARVFLAAGYALVLQVSHPTVAAGVRDFSSFEEDPWGRLLRTLDFTNALVYGGPEIAGPVGRNLRVMHRSIKGTKPDGTAYSALEPEAYAWVHATLLDGIIRSHERFGRPFAPGERERLYDEWRRVGRLVGVRERDLPERLPEFQDYVAAMMRDRLEDNDVVQSVLRSLMRPAAPPLEAVPEPAWRIGSLPVVHGAQIATAGLLPPLLRERFGLRWGRRQEWELRALGAVARATTPLMPRSLRNVGPPYLRWRREQVDALVSGPPPLPEPAPSAS